MPNTVRKLAWLAVAAVLLVQAGCATMAIVGAAGLCGAAGYVYYNGLLYRDFNATLGDSVAAVRTSLIELQLPLIEEKPDTASVYFRSKTGDGHPIRIYLDTVASPIPAEGAKTRISVRVGLTGDDVVSARVLDQVKGHLTPTIPAPPPVASPAPVLGTPRPPETAAPPLAPPANERIIPVAATGKR